MAEEQGGAFRRRAERAAGLRSARLQGARLRGEPPSGVTAGEDAELTAAENQRREARARIDHAAKAEYLIRDAMAQGKFENLKYAGKPIPGLGEGYDPDWWVKGLIQRENITGMGPRAILLRTEDAELDARLDTESSEKQVRDILTDFNARVVDARRELQGGPPVVTKTRDVDAEVRRWRDRRAEAAAAAAASAAEPDPGLRRAWWRRLWNGTG